MISYLGGVALRIALGSTNPVKVKATYNVMKRIYEGSVSVISVQVESGVKHTPMGESEIIKGAKNRAKNALKKVDADLGVGMEGGMVRKFDKYFLTGWCAVVDGFGRCFLGCSVYMGLPESVVKSVLRGKELGIVMDELIGVKDTKRRMGAIGIFTKGIMNRQAAWEAALIYAMSPIISSNYYMD